PAEQHAASWPVVLHLMRNDFVPFPEALIGVEVAQHPPSLRHHLANTAYAGALLIGPAAYALWRARNRMTRFFAALIAFGLLVGAEAPGVTNLLAHVPLLNLSITARMLS